MPYLQGLTMGLAYVAPIGDLFVIHSALTQRRRRALLTALIVVCFDVTLAAACFLGAGAGLARFPALERAVLLAGSLLVLWIGAGLLRNRGPTESRQEAGGPLGRTVSAACVVTWGNPQAILDGTLFLGAFRAALPAEEGAAFLLGVVSASCLWFFTLTALVQRFQARFSARVLRGVNVVCGCVLLLYGCRLLWTFLRGL